MSELLRAALMALAHWHMIFALLLTLFTLSPWAVWACEGKNDFLCLRPRSVWAIQHVFPESVSFAVQGFLVASASVNFGSLLMNRSRFYRSAVAVLDAVTFALGIIPWSLVLGFQKEAHGRPGLAMWVAVGATVIHMVAASLALTAILMPESKKAILNNDVEKAGAAVANEVPLLARHPRKKDVPAYLLISMELFTYVSAVAAAIAVVGLFSLEDRYSSLSAQGCQLTAFLLTADAAVVCALIKREVIDVGMGSIIASSLSLVGWITGIAGLSLAVGAMGAFAQPATWSLISVLASIIVLSVGIYVGTRLI